MKEAQQEYGLPNKSKMQKWPYSGNLLSFNAKYICSNQMLKKQGGNETLRNKPCLYH